MKKIFGIVLGILLLPLFGLLVSGQVSSSASASSSSDGPMEVTIGTFNFVSGDSLALEIVREEDCECMCDPIYVTEFRLENDAGAVSVLLNGADGSPSIDEWVGMMILRSPEGEALPAGKYTAVVETSAGMFKVQISIASPGAAASWGRVSSSASICGVEIRLYRLLTNEGATTIDLHIGDRLMIALPGNATTGYAWELIDGGETEVISSLEGRGYIPDSAPEGMVGVGGTFFFRYAAESIGNADLTFTYRRPWEEGEGTQTITFHVNVR